MTPDNAGIGHRIYAGGAWIRHFGAAAFCLGVSGVLRLAEWFIAHGLGGIREEGHMARNIGPVHRNLHWR